jgi:hypothetical protein
MAHPYETWKDVEVVERALWAAGLTNWECDKFRKHRAYEVELKDGKRAGSGPKRTLWWNLRTGQVLDVWDHGVLVELLTADNADQVATYLRG